MHWHGPYKSLILNFPPSLNSLSAIPANQFYLFLGSVFYQSVDGFIILGLLVFFLVFLLDNAAVTRWCNWSRGHCHRGEVLAAVHVTVFRTAWVALSLTEQPHCAIMNTFSVNLLANVCIHLRTHSLCCHNLFTLKTQVTLYFPHHNPSESSQPYYKSTHEHITKWCNRKSHSKS